MVENETADSAGSQAGDDPNVAKQAACLACRRSKVKCLRAPDAAACKRCTNASIDCIVPTYHVGRYKGVKNKRSGLEKAIYQVEEALKKAKTSGSGLQNEHTQALQRLLDETRSGPDHFVQLALGRKDGSRHAHHSSIGDPFSSATSPTRPNVARSLSMSSPRRDTFAQPEKTGEVTINNADNPLQLLAIASAIPEDPRSTASPSTAGKVSPDSRTISTENRTIALGDEDETHDFFSPTTSRLDIDPELDPINLGLLTVEESRMLFA